MHVYENPSYLKVKGDSNGHPLKKHLHDKDARENRIDNAESIIPAPALTRMCEEPEEITSSNSSIKLPYWCE